MICAYCACDCKGKYCSKQCAGKSINERRSERSVELSRRRTPEQLARLRRSMGMRIKRLSVEGRAWSWIQVTREAIDELRGIAV